MVGSTRVAVRLMAQALEHASLASRNDGAIPASAADLSFLRRPRPAAPLVQVDGTCEAGEDEIRQQRVEEAFAIEEAREPAGPDHDRRLSLEDVFPNLPGEAPQHRPVAEVETRLDPLDRRPAEERVGRDDLDGRQSRRVLLERLHRDAQPRQDDPTQVVPPGAHDIDRGGRASFGYLASAGLLFTIGYAVYGRIRKTEVHLKHSHESDWIFLWMLLLVTATGVLQHILHRTGTGMAANMAYLIHLALVVPMLTLEVPFSKWSHLAYRPLAMYLGDIHRIALARHPKAAPPMESLKMAS